MSNATERGKADAIVREKEGEVNLLSKILEEGRLVQHENQAQQARDMIAEFVQQAMQGQMVLSRNLEASVQARIAEIDRLLSAQLNEIMHSEPYQKLEGSWRGLHHLVYESETSVMLKIRVLNVSKKDLLKDLERAAEFDQSAVFKKVYEEEYGTFGGQPFGALIGDFYFSNHPQDMLLLEKMAQVAAAANAPFIAASAPQLFGWESFQEMTEVRDLAKIFDRTEYAKWRSFRDSEDSRYVGLTMPRTLMRLPYGKETIPTETFNFEEDVDGKDHNKYLWGNAAYSFGTRLTEAFAMYGWCVAIRG
ncbi:MAG TPA: type VI secretion system contractile sheath large subunit, partial [Thermoanaerobaculia bacterium]|nr:type VI secretion system contractile sheath large subunit [Thermoanaerobaculia bacterium]